VAQTTEHHADHVQAAVEHGFAAKSAMVASWRRSSFFHRLDPAERNLPRQLTAAEFNLARQRIEPLVRAAQSNLDRLFLAVGGVGCCVLLADRNGVPVDRRGATSDDETFRSWGLWTATVWSEDCEGTNGIGTCLAEQRALTVHRDQHYYARNTLLSCTSAPIYDHEGKLAAALDVSSCRADLTEGFVQSHCRCGFGCRTANRDRKFSPGFSEGPLLVCAGRRARRRVDRGRCRRPRHWRYSIGATGPWRDAGFSEAAVAGDRPPRRH